METSEIDGALSYYRQILETDGIDDVSKLNTIIKISLIYKEEKNDLDNALLYALMGCTKTFSPRADLCCLIGDIYHEKGNDLWAERWYRDAIGNIPQIGETISFNKDYLMRIPLLKLSVLYYDTERYDEGLECVEAILKAEPDDEDALHNREKIVEKMK